MHNINDLIKKIIMGLFLIWPWKYAVESKIYKNNINKIYIKWLIVGCWIIYIFQSNKINQKLKYSRKGLVGVVEALKS